MGEYLAYPAQMTQPRHGHGKALLAGLVTAAVCLALAGATATVPVPKPDTVIAGVRDLPAPPTASSWAPRPVVTDGLTAVATSGGGQFRLHTAGGDRTFLPGVNLGSTTPGHQPGELAITAEDYRDWFAAMGWLGVRVVRVYTIHPPAFYQELRDFNDDHPDRPIYLVQGVYLPDESYAAKGDLYDDGVTRAFSAELRDASAAVTGDLVRRPARGRAGGTWDADVTPWLAGWIVGVEWDPAGTAASDRKNRRQPQYAGAYFGATPDATPTERWLAARMDELAELEAGRDRGAPIAFVNWPTTDPLRHPDEPLSSEDLVGVDANHVVPTAAWPAGTFASYHAYPYYPDFQRHEPALQSYRHNGRPDPYAGYLAALKRHHGDTPVLITEFGVPSSIGSAHNAPLGRSQGDHAERDAMRIDAELLRLIRDVGLSAGFVFAWTDEWFKFTWNTVEHQDGERRQLWHDVLTNEQHFGLVALDAAGLPETGPSTVLADGDRWPVRAATAKVDEAFVTLRLRLASPRPAAVTVGLDVLPQLTGLPAPASGDTRADAALTFDLVNRTGQAYLRDELDPLPLDYVVPGTARGPAPQGWQRFQLIVNRDLTVPSTGRRLPLELLDAGVLRHGSWDPADPAADSRNLWRLDGDDLVVRVPWAFAGYADPSDHQVHLPGPVRWTDRTALNLARSPGIDLSASATGTDQPVGQVRWDRWQRVHYTSRLKQGADAFRDALVDTGR
ncbi:hypothetical protein [Spirilliplanes yamanashiensis]|uniref:Uncharacterized protein n=1 Tax=Spirilliplanes yamanashiensis TaxID=42233 RepID=A0A8J4DK59_9ACTN|nr:hypothetical protein [Spirilliplanes yamanashiensis]MDP9815750.1 hypothetical protein [Spirilliplanes yamanashiensis]GIJ04004.1 hypothetical protein Sya03_33560 [Spirilliplanes yamanashiensis]